MPTPIQSLRAELERRKGRAAQIESELRACKKDLKVAERELKKHQQAREIIKKVGLATQQQLEYHFSDVVTSALVAVFPDPYALKVSFVERRGKTECDIELEKNGETFDPLGSTGGGVVDIAAFALRIAAWAMQSPRTRPFLVLDEPFRYLSTGLQDKAGAMLKELSSKLGIQILMITHEENLEDCADRVFEIRQSRGVSHVRER